MSFLEAEGKEEELELEPVWPVHATLLGLPSGSARASEEVCGSPSSTAVRSC